MRKLLIVDDEANVLYSLERGLQSDSFEIITARTARQGIEFVRQAQPAAAIFDVRLPDMSGLDAFDLVRKIDARLPVIVITAHATSDIAIEAMKRGAFDYLLKPVDLHQLREVVQKAMEQSRISKVPAVFDAPSEPDAPVDQIVGRSAAMQEVYKLIGRVAPQDVTVLIMGESGTGKELVARALYRQSPRANAPFIKVNCAAIPENLIESEFFGHERGAFTGALNKREGRFELAHGGTILLDEISEISPQVQAKLLRVLQEREFERVGGNRSIKVDVRVVATTNRHLEQSVAKKEFRQDLFFRLNVVPIHVPPLRERTNDVPMLAEQFMRRYTRKHGVAVRGVSPRCLAALRAHQWPGNVRELQNVIERAVILCGEDDYLAVEHLGFETSEVGAAPSPAGPPPENLASGAPLTIPGTPPSGEPPTLAELERRHILHVLEQTRGNRTQAAKLLDISVRTLRNKLHEYGVASAKDEVVEEPG